MKQTLKSKSVKRYCPDCRKPLPDACYDELYGKWRMNCVCGVILMWSWSKSGNVWKRTHRAGALFSIDKPVDLS